MRRVAVASLLLVAQPAGARPERGAVEIGLDYQAPPDCPTRDELERQITARSARIRVGQSAEPRLKFRVIIDQSWRAQIEVDGLAGEHSSREVRGETCREVATAAALIVAVLADPDAPGESEPAPPQKPAPEPEPAARPQPAPAAGKPSSGWSWQLVLGMQLSIETAPTPDPLLSPRPFVALESRAGSSEPRPVLRLSGARGSSGSIHTASGVAELVWTAARLDGCVALGDDEGPAAQPCASFELGTLRGRGFRTVDARDETEIWLAPGLLGRGAWGFGSLLRAELQAGLSFPLRRYRFFFGPDETAHQVPAVGFTAGLGIAVILP